MLPQPSSSALLARSARGMIWLFAISSTVAGYGQQMVDGSSPPATAAEFLQLYGIGVAGKWASVQDEQPLSQPERATVLRMLYRLPRVSQRQLNSWARPDWSVASLQRDPVAFRGETLLVRGEVLAVQRLVVPAPASARFRF